MKVLKVSVLLLGISLGVKALVVQSRLRHAGRNGKVSSATAAAAPPEPHPSPLEDEKKEQQGGVLMAVPAAAAAGSAEGEHETKSSSHERTRTDEEEEGPEEDREETVAKRKGKAPDEFWCTVIAVLLILGCLAGMIPGGQGGVGCMPCIALIYVLATGIWTKYWAGDALGPWCTGLMILILLGFAQCALVCFVIGGLMGAAAVAANSTVKQMEEENKKRKTDGEISAEREKYFASEKFKSKCDDLFQKADTNKDGSLDMKELEASVLANFTATAKVALKKDPLFLEAFDTNKDSKINKEEFREMIKYFESGQAARI